LDKEGLEIENKVACPPINTKNDPDTKRERRRNVILNTVVD
jgi:hypothetical protein